MIRIALPHWRGRISPVFDVARQVMIIEAEGGVEQSRGNVIFNVDDPGRRVQRLIDTGAQVLICGAISRSMEVAIASAGIDVIPQTCGDLEAVAQAYREGRLTPEAFLAPGSGGRRRRPAR